MSSLHESICLDRELLLRVVILRILLLVMSSFSCDWRGVCIPQVSERVRTKSAEACQARWFRRLESPENPKAEVPQIFPSTAIRQCWTILRNSHIHILCLIFSCACQSQQH